MHPTNAAAQAALLDVVRRDPGCFGVARTRWRLEDLRWACPWLRLQHPGSLSALLSRLKIAYQRGRDYVHSPDPDYADKVAYRNELIERVRKAGGQEALLFLDELTYYRQPTLTNAWEARGGPPPLAQRSHRANTPTRVVATLDLLEGRVLARQASKIDVAQLVGFYQQVRQAYPHAQRLYLVLDNWPVHFHPDVLVALEPQRAPWKPKLPPDWPEAPSRKAQARWGAWQLPLQLVPLPTYASWLNPIEKLWRLLKQDLLHLHRFADRLDELRAAVLRFLEQFARGSPDLLRYVGLLPN